MATANRSEIYRRRLWPNILLALVVLALALGFLYREPIQGYSTAGAAYGAKTVCSCRYLAGRDLASCKTDFEPGMEVVFISDSPEQKSVTAYVPLLASDTAVYREGAGCVLDRWER